MDNNVVPRLITNGVTLEDHEMATVVFLQATLMVDIELIPPSHTPGMRSPDLIMCGLAWEMKSPRGKDLRTIEHAFKNASKQSENIIIDLRRMMMDDERMVRLLDKLFILSRRVKRMKILVKSGKVIDRRKKSC